MKTKVSLIGAPTDIGAGTRGSSMGPEALRVANIGPVLESHGLEVLDRGNLSGPPNPWKPPEDGYRHLDAVVAWNQQRPRRRPRRADRRPDAGAARRRPLPGHRLDQRRRPLLPRDQQEAARPLARRPRRLQHQPAHPERQPARHAGRLPVRLRAAGADRDRRQGAGDQPEVGAPDRHPQRRRRREEVRARARPRGVRHALHRRDGHAPHHGAGAGDDRRQHPPARQLRRRLPRRRHRPRRRHHRQGRARPTARRSSAWR